MAVVRERLEIFWDLSCSLCAEKPFYQSRVGSHSGFFARLSYRRQDWEMSGHQQPHENVVAQPAAATAVAAASTPTYATSMAPAVTAVPTYSTAAPHGTPMSTYPMSSAPAYAASTGSASMAPHRMAQQMLLTSGQPGTVYMGLPNQPSAGIRPSHLYTSKPHRR